MDEQKQAVGLGTFAKMFDVSRDTMGRAADRGELKTIYICGRRMVPRSEVDRVKLEGLGSRKNASRKAGTARAARVSKVAQ
jgi:hypothetical protein